MSRPRGELALAAALLSAAAAAIHASAAGPHLHEYAPYGVLFVATALVQAAWAALVVTAPSVTLLGGGVVLNLGVAGTWALSRTAGLPFGPEPWTAEPAGGLDVAATGLELGIVAVSLVRLAAGGPYAAVSDRAVARLAAVAATAIAAFASAASAATFGGAAHHHDHARHDHGAAVRTGLGD